MTRGLLRLGALTVAVLGGAWAQSTLDYGLYRTVTVKEQSVLKRTAEGRVGERLVWMGVLGVQQTVTGVVSTIPVPDGTLYAGDLQVPAGTTVGFSTDGQTFGPAASTRTRFVRATLPLATAGQAYTIRFSVQITGP